MLGISKIFHGGSGGRSTGYGPTIVTKLFDQSGFPLLHGEYIGDIDAHELHLSATDIDNVSVVCDGHLRLGAQKEASIRSAETMILNSIVDVNIGSDEGSVNITSIEASVTIQAAVAGKISLLCGDGIHTAGIKFGVSQAAAGAMAGEIWCNTATNGLFLGI